MNYSCYQITLRVKDKSGLVRSSDRISITGAVTVQTGDAGQHILHSSFETGSVAASVTSTSSSLSHSSRSLYYKCNNYTMRLLPLGAEPFVFQFAIQKFKNQDIIIIISIQPEGRVWQEPEPSQATGMALAHCILGSFLGVVCHCFPPRWWSMRKKITFFRQFGPYGWAARWCMKSKIFPFWEHILTSNVLK